MKKLLVLLSFLLFSAVSDAKATTFDQNECLAFGKTAANMTLVIQAGASFTDILRILDNNDFKSLPKDVQILIVTLAKFLITKGQGYSPEENFQGATEFCLAGGGDVEKMAHVLETAMGTTI